MPYKPKRPCTAPGCLSLSDSPRCPEHTKQDRKQVDSRRGTATQRGYGVRWRSARARYLAEHPLCRECQKNRRITPANVVDHVAPHKGNQELFWDTANWQALCKPCHDTKTDAVDGGFGNRPG